MAITSEIIGKLGGGADVETVEIARTDTNGGSITLHTVEVAAGEEVLAVFIGRFSKLSSSESTKGTLSLGGSTTRASATNQDTAVAAVVTETTNIVLTGGLNVSGNTLASGTVYTVKL